MKKNIIFFLVLLLMPITVFAESFETKAGYLIPEEDYNKLSKLYNDVSIYMMDYDKYQSLMNSDINFDNVSTKEIYVYSVCNTITHECEEKEITEEEYNNDDAVYLPTPYINSTYETASKRLVIHLSEPSSGSLFFTLTNTWKTIPKVRSFDVIGVRIAGFSVSHGSESGDQIYVLNGAYQAVHYSANGTNIRYLHNGVGISQNIVNSNITYLQNSIEGVFIINSVPAVVYGSYQHATADIDLATSKDYTFGSGGLGGVFIYNGTSGSAYDQMLGVYDNILSQ